MVNSKSGVKSNFQSTAKIPAWTGQHFLFDFSLKGRKPFFTPKRHLNLNRSAMPARKDGNLVIREGSAAEKRLLGTLHAVNVGVFPQEDSHAQHLSSCVQRDDAGCPSSSSSRRTACRRPSRLKFPDLAPVARCTAWLTEGCCSRFRHASVGLARGWGERTH